MAKGDSKGGAYTRSQVMSGSKPMSKSHMPTASGKMSSSHSNKSTNNNMSHNTGGYRVGSDCKTFGNTQSSKAPKDIK